MSRTVKRGAQPPARRPVARRKPVRPPLHQRLLQHVPVSEETVKRIATWTITGAGVVAAALVATWIGIPAAIGAAAAEQVGRAGLAVDDIQVTGLRRMDQMTVYAVALEDKRNATSMASVDLEGIRQRLLRYGWIKDAQVSRRLPNLLLINIEEREPAAVWQDNGQLTLIDEAGVLLEPVDPDAIPDLPLVIGPGADRQEAAYQQLLAAAPALKPRIKAATWIGNRRWDLTFNSGEVLALPEDGAAAALVRFAELDGARALLGRGWLRFDMRDPAKLVARKPGASLAHSVPDDGVNPPAVDPAAREAAPAGGQEEG